MLPRTNENGDFGGIGRGCGVIRGSAMAWFALAVFDGVCHIWLGENFTPTAALDVSCGWWYAKQKKEGQVTEKMAQVGHYSVDLDSLV